MDGIKIKKLQSFKLQSVKIQSVFRGFEYIFQVAKEALEYQGFFEIYKTLKKP